jgi:hypothetical protein
MFDYEDVTIGSWMLAMNVNHEDNRAMCDSTCTPTSIAVWDNKPCSGMHLVNILFSKYYYKRSEGENDHSDSYVVPHQYL